MRERSERKHLRQPILFAIAFLLACLVAPSLAKAATPSALGAAASDITLTNINTGKQVDFLDTYGDGFVVVIGGRPGCSNTKHVVEDAFFLSQYDEWANLRFVVMDCDGAPSTFKSAFQNYDTDRLAFYSDYGSSYNNWLWSEYRKGGGSGSSITLPWTLLYKNGHLVKWSTGWINLSSYLRDYLNYATMAMYRLYNPNSGEHFYTASEKERDALVQAGWGYEGVGWTAPATSSEPVYRLYSGTDHHYCTSSSERKALVKAGWTYEGIGWYSYNNSGVPLYRQFNPNVDPSAPTNNSGSHNYTTDKAENDALVQLGWRAEGIGWYGVR